MARALVISGFPGVGKTTLERYERITDLESSGFHWIWVASDPFAEEYPTTPAPKELRLNPVWPKNYIDKIDELSKKDYQKIILISAHAEVRELLQKQKIPYIIVCPTQDCKNEYMIRYLRRGSDAEFIAKMDKSFCESLVSLANDPAPKIYLARGQYLQDVLPPL
jgi:hypothetical protein